MLDRLWLKQRDVMELAHINVDMSKVVRMSRRKELIRIIVRNQELERPIRYLRSLVKKDFYCTEDVRSCIVRPNVLLSRRDYLWQAISTLSWRSFYNSTLRKIKIMHQYNLNYENGRQRTFCFHYIIVETLIAHVYSSKRIAHRCTYIHTRTQCYLILFQLSSPFTSATQVINAVVQS